jgi:hypothetical protein
VSKLTKILKCNITLLGLFPLPDIFVNKDNFSDEKIKRGVYEGKLNRLYELQSELPINFEYFDGPRRLPNEREKNKFWKTMIDYGVWAPLFYKSSDNLKVEIVSCEDEPVKNFFNKLSQSEKAPIRFFIRVFPIGGYSIHIIFDFTISNNSECFTIEDLQTIIEDLFNSIQFKITTNSGVIISNTTISEIFEELGSKIRDKFLLNPNQIGLNMTKHAIINIDKYEGDWRKEDIVDLTGESKKLGIYPEHLTLKEDDNCVVNDVYYSGETCTLRVPATTETWTKYLKNMTIDVAEFVHLRKLIVEEYTKHINKKNNDFAAKIDNSNFWIAIKSKIRRRKVTWINERFIANLQTVIELDRKIPSLMIKKNIVLGMLEKNKYEDTLNELKKELEKTQNYAERYNKDLSRRLEDVKSTIEFSLKFLPYLGAL